MPLQSRFYLSVIYPALLSTSIFWCTPACASTAKTQQDSIAFPKATASNIPVSHENSGSQEYSSPQTDSASQASVGQTQASSLPLSPQQKVDFNEGPEDPTIPVDIHYVQSNETRHDLFFPYIRDLGGVYVGVGSDQNFTLMSKSRCTYAFLMDIDYRVVGLHRMYQILIPRAPTPEDLIAFFDKKNQEQTETILKAELSTTLSEKQQRITLDGFRAARETVFRHLQRVHTRSPRNHEASTWLSNPDMYQYIRMLYQHGRVRVMSGNLTGEQSLLTIAQATQKLGEKVSVIYMSNAEEYFKYTPQFVHNMTNLPGHEKAVVLRTIYSKKWAHADLWAYQVQSLTDFKTRLQNRLNRSRSPMLRYAAKEGTLNRAPGPKGLSLVGMEAPTYSE